MRVAIIMEETLLYKADFEVKRNKDLCEKFHSALRSSKYLKKEVSQYLNDRKLDNAIIDKYLIGWCPEDVKFPIHLEQFKALAGRIVFPIIDEYGDVVSFSGRLPTKEKVDGVPKWWHGSYVKAFFLYGLNNAIDSIIEKDYVVIVEGQIDTITCNRCGIDNVVGSMGTALTYQHIEKLSRLTNRFVLMFDGDKAGRSASKSTIEYFDFYNNTSISKKIINYKYYDIPLIYKGVEYDSDEFINKYGSKPIIDKIDKELKKDVVIEENIFE